MTREHSEHHNTQLQSRVRAAWERYHDPLVVLVAIVFFGSLYYANSFWLSALVFVLAIALAASPSERDRARFRKILTTRKEKK